MQHKSAKHATIIVIKIVLYTKMEEDGTPGKLDEHQENVHAFVLR